MLSKEDVFEGSTNRNVPGSSVTLASERLLDCLIQIAEKSRSAKCHNGTVKCGIKRYKSLTFLTFFIIKNLFLYLKSKVLISNVDTYPLHAHDIK